jgi:hypothetical protein
MQTNSESHTLVAFFVTSGQLAFSYSRNIGEQDYICWHLCWTKMQNFQAGFESFSFEIFASTEVRP